MPDCDFERRFGGLRRLYGPHGASGIFQSHVIVVGVGGVGSWAVEALARSGVGRLTLIDMDHVSESNINRQIQAMGSTLGMAKIEALRVRIEDINPQCEVRLVDDFVTPENAAELLGAVAQESLEQVALLDACDQVRAKTALAAWGSSRGIPTVTVGAAGGKRAAHRVEVADLSDVTHDPLLARLRQGLRKQHGGKRNGSMGLSCVFSREPVAPPDAACQVSDDGGGPGAALNCHGYGSSVAVTAAFGFAAAGILMEALAGRTTR